MTRERERGREITGRNGESGREREGGREGGEKGLQLYLTIS